MFAGTPRGRKAPHEPANAPGCSPRYAASASLEIEIVCCSPFESTAQMSTFSPYCAVAEVNLGAATSAAGGPGPEAGAAMGAACVNEKSADPSPPNPARKAMRAVVKTAASPSAILL